MATSKNLSSIKLIRKPNTVTITGAITAKILSTDETIVMRVTESENGSVPVGTLTEASYSDKVSFKPNDLLKFDGEGNAVEYLPVKPEINKPAPARQGSTRIPQNL